MKYYSRLPFAFPENRLILPSWDQVRAPLLVAVSVVLVAGLEAGLVLHFRVGLSPSDSSCAEGFYRLVDAPIRRGALVAACLPSGAAQQGLARGYLAVGDCPGGAEAVLKVVMGLPGDAVEVEREWIAVNGARLPRSATVARDSAGRALAHVPWGSRAVAADEVWLFGLNDRRSWDSRYFGPVPLRELQGVVQPVLTW